MREFETGATRDAADDKYDLEGFEHPAVLEAFCRYMHIHRKQADGNLRDSDNWQKGIPKTAYMKSLLRHVLDLWFLHRGIPRFDVHGDGHPLTIEEVCCAIRFNVNGYLFEELRPAIEALTLPTVAVDEASEPDRTAVVCVPAPEKSHEDRRVCQSCAYRENRYCDEPCVECVKHQTPIHWEAKR